MITKIIKKHYLKRNTILKDYSTEKEIFELIKSINDYKDFFPNEFNEPFFSMQYDEAYILFKLVKSIKNLKGSIAEIGVYNGGSAKLILEAENIKKVFLCDTFEGLPIPSKEDKEFKKGQFDTSFKEVTDYLKNYPNKELIKGLFPQSATKEMKEKLYSFVHLDVDLYKSTKECLDFFYPRMVNKGIILTHDYDSKGVRKAFDEFFKDKKSYVIDFGTQGICVK